ncbi:MAG: PHP domain-containing protein [Lachnospiraceae bacterium]|jgi:predicted metal-dependent phosphoesterase TrpH|nr:PHP domain-containing protein [Lachnospiraceae bacterium]MCI8973925.1 PHP domain-containing protein [Lachnospiraceae bacterium]
MKFDMHCHTKEGSMDGKIPIAEYVQILKSKGFQGMLVTDHDSYNGFRRYRDHLKGKLDGFVVLKGIEYDTIDAGHILVILPEHVKLLLMECRGLPVRVLQEVVHRHGGILGPAHPCGERHLSITRTRAYKKNPAELMKHFDFVEAFNACESPESNTDARRLAMQYGLPMFGGSDSHHPDCVGTAYTEVKDNITCESALISYIKEGHSVNYGGEYYHGTVKGKLGVFNHVLVEGFWFYNHFASIYRHHKRKLALSLLNQ